ncbi:sulfurtransferase TusA family protein [Rubrivivax sp. JA1026]|uniref:sulfurtransferase TusA family protein n=1 Tax=Rubrivivax sp. JA1026 TaxID=2710888 RepID=UPI0013E9517E|nr:sulfurtransferase TusA family protein [Rubrivivax sp. JA1026]
MTIRFTRLEPGRYLLDVKGYVCPHPQIYTRKALAEIAAGDRLTVEFDNPSSGESIGYLCEQEGARVLERQEQRGTFRWTLQKD